MIIYHNFISGYNETWFRYLSNFLWISPFAMSLMNYHLKFKFSLINLHIAYTAIIHVHVYTEFRRKCPYFQLPWQQRFTKVFIKSQRPLFQQDASHPFSQGGTKLDNILGHLSLRQRTCVARQNTCTIK